jgi:beta-lactam-binding protein with PASTA domain
MRHSATRLVILLLVVVACTGEPPGQVSTSSSAPSPSASNVVVPDVVGRNFLEALVAVDPPFRLLDIRYRASSDVPNGTILGQRPVAGTPILSTEPEIVIRVVVSTSPG